MALPMMRYPGLLAQPQYMTPPAVDRRLAPPFAPPMAMGPAGGFDPFATKPAPPSLPPYGGPPRGILERLMPGLADNRAYDAFDRNRMALVAGFMNSIGQDGPRGSARGFAQGFTQGMGVDQERADKRDTRRKGTQIAKLLADNDPDLANMLETGGQLTGAPQAKRLYSFIVSNGIAADTREDAQMVGPQ